MFPTEQSAQLHGEPVAKQSPLCAVCSGLGCEVRPGPVSPEKHTTALGSPLYPGLAVTPATAHQSCVLLQLLPHKREKKIDEERSNSII